jgi:glutathione synthase/RimK-type ligase-like ATP-grasp enzyme
LIIGIHPDRIGKESYSEKWAEYIHAIGGTVRQLNLLAPDALEQASQCDGVMWRWAHNPQDKQSAQRILYVIEHYLNIPVYPNTSTAWHFDEKISQYYLLRALQAPTPDTRLFWSSDTAIQWAKTAAYPLVLKLSSGAGSSNVIKVNSFTEANQWIQRSFRKGIFPLTLDAGGPTRGIGLRLKSFAFRMLNALKFLWKGEYPALPFPYWKPEHGYVYFQEFLSGNDFDTRVAVIGSRAFGFRRLNRPGDFRASGSGRLDFNPSLVDPKCVELAFRISKQAGFQSMAYDFLFRDSGDPVISEISYGFADWAVQKCFGYWLPDLTWKQGPIWPEQAQVEDFIHYIQSPKHQRLEK